MLYDMLMVYVLLLIQKLKCVLEHTLVIITVIFKGLNPSNTGFNCSQNILYCMKVNRNTTYTSVTHKEQFQHVLSSQTKYKTQNIYSSISWTLQQQNTVNRRCIIDQPHRHCKWSSHAAFVTLLFPRLCAIRSVCFSSR